MEISARTAISGTKTEQNLREALNMETSAHTLYSLYAENARANGDEALAKEFENAAGMEKTHAKMWLEYLGEISADEMLSNIMAAEAAEQYDYEISYPEFANVAEDEGFGEIAEKFRRTAEVEHGHRDKMKHLSLEYSSVLPSAKDDTKWQCLTCGYVHTGTTPPERCPLCSYPHRHYQCMN